MRLPPASTAPRADRVMPAAGQLTPRARVRAALAHRQPDRVPADFLATPKIWEELHRTAGRRSRSSVPAEYVEPAREAVLRRLEIDLRVLSYDMLCDPPETAVGDGVVDWWSSLDRSSPNRMWRRRNADGTTSDVWGNASEDRWGLRGVRRPAPPGRRAGERPLIALHGPNPTGGTSAPCRRSSGPARAGHRDHVQPARPARPTSPVTSRQARASKLQQRTGGRWVSRLRQL